MVNINHFTAGQHNTAATWRIHFDTLWPFTVHSVEQLDSFANSVCKTKLMREQSYNHKVISLLLATYIQEVSMMQREKTTSASRCLELMNERLPLPRITSWREKHFMFYIFWHYYMEILFEGMWSDSVPQPIREKVRKALSLLSI